MFAFIVITENKGDCCLSQRSMDNCFKMKISEIIIFKFNSNLDKL